MIHGGDIYDKKIELDYSVNVNPYGPAQPVLDAMHAAVEHSAEYPEYDSARLKNALAESLGLDPEFITLTAGASEAFLSIAQAFRPERAVLQSPSFFGYEYACNAAGAKISKVRDLGEVLRECGGGCGCEDSMPDIIYCANPNNPTSLLMDEDVLMGLAKMMNRSGRLLVVDECFLTLAASEDRSLIYKIKDDPELRSTIIVRSFTKTFAIPGVRLGYIVCSDPKIHEMIRAQLPEWNLSNIAQEAGLAALKVLDQVKDEIAKTLEERERLAGMLADAGLTVFPGYSNFILTKGPADLKEKLLAHGILIRDCSNFTGLEKGYFRFAVRLPEQNDRLYENLKAVLAD